MAAGGSRCASRGIIWNPYDEPLYTISLTDSEKGEETLYFGEMTDDNYYVMAETTGNIYTVSSTAVTYLEHTLDEMAEDDE